MYEVKLHYAITICAFIALKKIIMHLEHINIYAFKPYNRFMDIKKILGLKIKKLRQQSGLTQEQFAEKIGIATRTLAGIEIGESFVSANTIENILNYTGLSFEDFIICSHLRPIDDLMQDIYSYLDKIKDNREKVENIYKVIKSLANE